MQLLIAIQKQLFYWLIYCITKLKTFHMKPLLLLLSLTVQIGIAQHRPIVINECMPNNSLTAVDQDGEYNDWVELYNNSASSYNMEGYFLSDRKSEPTKFKFPSLNLNSNQFLIVWLDKDTLQEGLHTNFKLSASSEQLYLFDVDTHLVDYVHFYNVDADESVARTTNGNGSFIVTTPTFNQSNINKENGLVINEWMANNTNSIADENDEYNDWIELYNNSNSTINLNGYFLSNKANEATKYKFPNIQIAANDYLVVWADEDTLQGELHLPFKLDSERDDIVLSRPDTSTIDYFFHHNVDSNITMARIPNGTGDIALGNFTFESSNQPFIYLDENSLYEIELYPNPTTDYISINTQNDSNYSIELLDLNGRVISSFDNLNSSATINLTKYSDGIYFLRTPTGKSYKVIKTSLHE